MTAVACNGGGEIGSCDAAQAAAETMAAASRTAAARSAARSAETMAAIENKGAARSGAAAAEITAGARTTASARSAVMARTAVAKSMVEILIYLSWGKITIVHQQERYRVHRPVQMAELPQGHPSHRRQQHKLGDDRIPAKIWNGKRSERITKYLTTLMSILTTLMST